MRTLCVLSRKGGTGKTTVSTSLALAGHLRGYKIFLADVDPQHSARDALSARRTQGPGYQATTGGKLFILKSDASLRGVDLFLIDTPAGLDPCVYEAIQIADICLIVTRPNYLDVASALISANIVRQLNKPALIVINQAPTGRDGAEALTTTSAREALRFVHYPVADAAVCSRTTFVKATILGQSVEESDPKSLAALEMANLWDEVVAVTGVSHAAEQGPAAQVR